MGKFKLFLTFILLVTFIISSSGCAAYEAGQQLAEKITEALNDDSQSETAADTNDSETPSANKDDNKITDIRKYKNSESDTKDASTLTDGDIWDPYKNPEEASDPAEEKRFTEYADKLIGEFPPLSIIDQLYLFADPKAAGLNMTAEDEDQTYKEMWNENNAILENMKDKLNGFDIGKLSRKSAITLQLLKDSIDSSLLDKDYYLISSNNLGLSSSIFELPNLIAEAPVRTEQDIVDILDMIASLPESYEEYVEIEKERQDAGVGMNSTEIGLVLDELDRIIAPKVNPVQTSLEETIDNASFLTDTRKDEFKKQTEQYIKDYYIPAYEYVREELSDIEGRKGVPGLAGAEGGADYYKIIFKQMGIDLTPEEAQAYLLNEFNYYKDVSTMIIMANPEFINAYLGETELDITSGMSSQEIVEYLEKAIQEEFKDVGKISYTVKNVPPEMEMPGVAAYYLTKPLDAGNSEPASIYINTESSDGDFITLAHEGFPGHMYQDAYQRTLKRPYALDLLNSYKVFTEGWGTYSQVIAAGYAPENQEYAYLLAIDEFMNGLLYAYMDIGINYMGWDKEKVMEEMEKNFDIGAEDSEELVNYMLEHLPTDPGAFVAYYLGAAKMLELRSIAEEGLGDKFNAVDFNSAILDIAPAPLNVIESAVYNYIDQTLNGADKNTDSVTDKDKTVQAA